MFKKKAESDIAIESVKLIERNANLVSNFAVLTQKIDGELSARFKEIQERLRFLKPVSDKADMKTDLKISDKLDDLKIELSRSENGRFQKAKDIVRDIEFLITARV